MEDYIACLLHWLETQPTAISPQLSALLREEEAAMAALRETFTPPQRALFLRYEAARNAAASAGESQLARRVFLLAKKIYR